MNINNYLYLIIVVFCFILLLFKDYLGNRNTRTIYVSIIIFILILISSLRGLNVGPDTNNYFLAFENLKSLSWANIIDDINESYKLGVGRDPGYSIFVKFLQIFISDFHLFLFLIAIVFYIPLGYLLLNYTTNISQILFAFILFVSLFIIITLSGIRQQITMGFSFISLIFLLKEQNLKFFIIVIIGSFIHLSLIVFISLFIFYKIIQINYIKKIHLITIILIPIIGLFSKKIIEQVTTILSNDYYSTYSQSEQSINGIFYLILISLISIASYIIINKRIISLSKINKILYSSIILTTLFAPLILLDGTMIRLGQYFSIYLMFLVPLIIEKSTKNLNFQKILYCISIISLIALTLNSYIRYSFYW